MTTATMTPAQRRETFAKLAEARDELATALAAMPAAKQGSPWHQDRQRQLDAIRRQIAGLAL